MQTCLKHKRNITDKEILVRSRLWLLTALSAENSLNYVEQFASITLEDWQEIVKVARKHYISPLLYFKLKGLKLDIPRQILESLRDDYLQNIVRNMKLFHSLKIVLKKFQQEKILTIPLKGSFLAQHIYPNMGLRAMSDIDLLIKKDEIMRAGNSLKNLGYSPGSGLDEIIPEEYQFGFSGSGLLIELHYKFTYGMHRTHPDIEAIWRRSTPSKIEDVPIQAMTPEEQILYLCVHSCKHAFEHGLRPLTDISETIFYYKNELNWNTLFQRAQEWGATRSLFVNLWLAKKLLSASIDESWLKSIQPKDLDEKILYFSEECIFINAEEPQKALANTENVVKLWKEKGIVARLKKLWKFIFPSRLFLSSRYHISPSSWKIYLYYPIRFKDLINRHGKIILQLLSGNNQTVARTDWQFRIDSLRDWLLSE